MQFIDGDNPQLFNAANICQGNIDTWFDTLEDIDDDSDHGISIRYLLSLGYSLSDALDRAEGVQIHRGAAHDYAYDLYSDTDIPAHLANYIDYDMIARDLELSGDIAEFDFETFITNAHEFWAFNYLHTPLSACGSLARIHTNLIIEAIDIIQLWGRDALAHKQIALQCHEIQHSFHYRKDLIS